jgi:hypothetical protein
MSSSTKPPRKTSDAQSVLALLDQWPDSWAGLPEDRPIGRGLVAELRPFVMHLQLNLSPKTVRSHVNNLWVIGGEIIRQVNYEPQLRKLKPRKLLLDAIDLGEAPLARDATEEQQNSLDATARRLLRFLIKPDIG